MIIITKGFMQLYLKIAVMLFEGHKNPKQWQYECMYYRVNPAHACAFMQHQLDVDLFRNLKFRNQTNGRQII